MRGDRGRHRGRDARGSHAGSSGLLGDSVADPNRGLFEAVVRLPAPVLDELVFVGAILTGARRPSLTVYNVQGCKVSPTNCVHPGRRENRLGAETLEV